MPNYPLRFVEGDVVYTAIDPTVGSDPDRGPINVLSFGAVGDGVADDTEAITFAIARLDPERGGVVFFPPGRYKVTSTIVVDRSVILAGSGMGDHLATGDHSSISASAGTWDTASQGTAIVTDSATLNPLHVNYPGCTIRDLAVINTRYTSPTAGSGIRVELGNSFRMQRVRVAGFYDCVAFEQSEYATLTDCIIEDAVRHGVWARNLYHVDQGDLSVVGCAFAFSGWRGAIHATGAAIRLESGGGLRFVSSKINCGPPPTQAKWPRGIDVDVTGTTGVILVTGSSIENTATAIRIVGTINNIAITGNQSSGITTGVTVDGPDRVVVTGNVFTDATTGVSFTNVASGIIAHNLGGTVTLGSGNTGIQIDGPPLTGTAAPATTPVYIGAQFIDTTAGKVYVATGIASSADWKILN